MKKFIVLSVVFIFSLLLVNCGSGDLTSGKAKDVIEGELDLIVNKLKEAAKDLDANTLKEADAKIDKMKENIKVDGVRKEGDSFIARVNGIDGKAEDVVEVKFNKYDTGWKIDELKVPNGKWMSKDKVLMSLEFYLKRSLFTGKLKATMGDMKSIGSAVESYLTDNYLAPQVGTMDELSGLLVPFYIKVLPKKDAWGNNFLYQRGDVGSDKQDSYWVGSGGKNGKFEGFDQTAGGDDVIFHNGNFTVSPK